MVSFSFFFGGGSLEGINFLALGKEFFHLSVQLGSKVGDFINLQVQRFVLGGCLVFAGVEGRLAVDEACVGGVQEHGLVLKFGIGAGQSLL